MHESALAKQILEVALDAARAAGATRVTSVRGDLTEAEDLRGESVAFHFSAHARGTAAESAQLDLTLHRVRAQCTHCGTEYEPDHIPLCPLCESTAARITVPARLAIHSVETSD